MPLRQTAAAAPKVLESGRFFASAYDSQPSQSIAKASPIACGVSDLHHSYITHGAITCNGRQTREKNPAYLSGFCKCVQSLETPESITRNEQVSGSSPLVGSLKSAILQGKRKPGRTRSSPSYSNRTATRAWLSTILRPQQYIAYSFLVDETSDVRASSSWTSALQSPRKFSSSRKISNRGDAPVPLLSYDALIASS